MRSVLRRGSRQETDKGGISSIASTEEEQIDAQRHLSKEPSIFTTWREEVSRPFRTGALYAVPQGRPKNVAKIEKPHLQREKGISFPAPTDIHIITYLFRDSRCDANG